MSDLDSAHEGEQPIQVTMDTREPRESMLGAFRAYGTFSVDVRHLPLGDYLIDDALLVERKTMLDLVASIIEGRLFSQSLRLVEAPLPAALVVEGSDGDLSATAMRWEAIQGALVTVTLFMGLPVLRTRDQHDTVRTLAFAARQRRCATTDTLTRRTRRPKGKKALQSYVLQGLPGVGPTRAKRLLDRFGSMEGVITASAEALQGVEGLGPETIRKMRWAID